MFTPLTFKQKMLSHVTLPLFPFDVVILDLWHSRLKDVKTTVPDQTPCFVAKTICCSSLFINFQRTSYRHLDVWYHLANIHFPFILRLCFRCGNNGRLRSAEVVMVFEIICNTSRSGCHAHPRGKPAWNVSSRALQAEHTRACVLKQSRLFKLSQR